MSDALPPVEDALPPPVEAMDALSMQEAAEAEDSASLPDTEDEEPAASEAGEESLDGSDDDESEAAEGGDSEMSLSESEDETAVGDTDAETGDTESGATDAEPDDDAAIREIRELQRSTQPLIPFAAFSRLAREVSGGKRFTRSALEALQTAAEGYLIEMLHGSQMAALHAGRIGIERADLELVRFLREQLDRM